MKSTAWITGITGQDGSYLAELLLNKGYDVHGLVRRSSNYSMPNIEHIKSKLNLHWGDLENEHHLCSLIYEIQPNEIYNLASQSDVRVSFDIPEYTGNITYLGYLRLLEAVRKFSRHSKVYQASSCFPADTKILTRNIIKRQRYGKIEEFKTLGTRSIQDIRVGDEVLSYNEKSGGKEYKKVKKISSRISNNLYRISFSNNNELIATNNHPFYVLNKGWVKVDDLRVNDEVIQKQYNGLYGGIIRKGKTYKEIFGKNRAEEISLSNSLGHKGIVNPMKGKKYPMDHPIRLPNPKKAHKSWNEGLTTETSPKLRHIGNKISNTEKKMWLEDAYRNKMLVAFGNRRKMTSPERMLYFLLNKICPGEFKWNGNGQLMLLKGLAPDFINVNGKKKVSEVFGSYWKELKYGSIENYQKIRQKQLRQCGFDVLFINSLELKDKNKLGNKIKIYVYNPRIDIIGIVSIVKENVLTTVYNIEIEENHNFFARGILVHNSEMFGDSPPPQNEETKMNPQSPYAISKLASYQLGRIYRKAYDMFICNGILFNHESPRRGLNFVTRKITNTAAKIRLGKEDVLLLGNLDAERDWGYAKDYVEAMWLMMQQKEPNDFVIGTGEAHTVREFMEIALKQLDLDWKKYVKIDSHMFRPAETNYLLADASKAKKILKWEPKVKFEELIKIMVSSDWEKERLS